MTSPPDDRPDQPDQPDDQPEDRLHELFESAVADVEPRHGLDAIQSRTKVTHMSARPWYLGAAAAVVATAATIVAVTVIGNDGGTPSSGPAPAGSASVSVSPSEPTREASASPAVPSVEPSPSASQSAEQPGGTVAVPVYYLGETGRGPRLYREFHPGSATDALQAALDQAVGQAPEDPDYFTPWPSGTTVDGSFDGTGADGEIAITVTSPTGTSLHDRPTGMDAQTAEMAVQQLVYTAQAAVGGTNPVQFLLDGSRTDTLLGVPVSEPLARGEATSTLALVWIIAPEQGAQVSSPFTVKGIGAFFEANVTWKLLAADTGKVVKSGFAMAEECCRMAPYSFQVSAPPGDYTLLVSDEDASGGEGPQPFQDTKQVTITR
ncbi:Gmad2 immunoglobulin-like domain-containing protein [Nocardioides mesophilus]|uniref:GerMN domain-containing protein n=1 Tax=Nocardioides mesophilus TaxID=433659 RepID=A0A7G9RCM0_9ACTN|nr:Gmad2 immunoglobulin-like domain-containing protein [Nocardioides mesophilus]QNN53345.1 GerMN domain-containing protein [Nocardioides mesophilus]